MNKQPNQQQRDGRQTRQAGGQTDRARQHQQFEAGDGGNLAGRIRENMEVIGADDWPVGVVDRIEGGRIKLERDAKGQHGYLSLDQVQSVEGNKVRLAVNATAAERLVTPK